MNVNTDSLRHQQQLSLDVQLQEKQLVINKKKTLIHQLQKNHLILDSQSLSNLDLETLIVLYDLLKSKHDNDWNFQSIEDRQKIIFLVRDRIFRYCFQNKNSDLSTELKKYQGINCTRLIKQIEKILGNPNFINTVKKTEITASTFFKNLQFETLKKKENNEQTLNILHATVEYLGKSHAGGVGTVVEQMSRGQNKRKLTNPSVITGFYSFWKSELLISATFIGCVEFPYKGEIVCSSIYKTIESDGVVHFLIEPDPKYANLFNLTPGQGVYSCTDKSHTMDRFAYMSGAIAAFSSSYIGKDGKDKFDVVQSHNPALGGFIASLMKHYNPALVNSDHREIAPIILAHGAASGDEITESSSYLHDLAISIPAFVSKVSLLGLAFCWSWKSVWVSKVSKQNSLSSTSVLGLHQVTQHIDKQNRLHAVTNGCEPGSYAITNTEVYGSDALQSDDIDYFKAKRQMKQRLYEHGLITSPEKDLFLWLGRMDPHIKGIDILLPMVKEIHKRGGQCVVMGFPLNPNYCVPEVKALKKIASKYPETLKVYDKKSDQLEPFLNTTYNKGKAIRYAADVMLLPSRSEGAPMVVQELFSVGAALCCSNAGGIPDYVYDYDSSAKYNAFMFNCDFESKYTMGQNARMAVAKTFENYLTLSPEERNRHMHRWIMDVHQRWQWDGPKGPLNEYEEIYNQARSESKKRLEDKAREHEELKSNQDVLVNQLKKEFEYKQKQYQVFNSIRKGIWRTIKVVFNILTMPFKIVFSFFKSLSIKKPSLVKK